MDVKLKPCLAQNMSIWITWQLYLCTNETTVNSLTLTWFCCFLCTDKSWSFVDVVFMGTTMDVKYFLRVHFFLLFYILRQMFFMRWVMPFKWNWNFLLLEPEIWGGQLWKYEFWSDIWGIWSFCTQLFHTQIWVCSYPSCWLIHIFIQNTIRTIQ